MKIVIIMLLLVAFVQVGYALEGKKDYSEAFKLVEAWLDAQKDYEQLPGITAVVVEDQQVLWSGAYGLSNIEQNVKAKQSTIFSICSISKLFTSVAIMKLYDEGLLRLDDRVEDILPAYNLKQKYPESGPITVRSLMTHSSGLPREAAYPYWTGPDFPFPTREQIDKKLQKQETLYPSSTYFQYSNLGLSLLGEIVEERSGMPFNEYVLKHILKPLGLANTRTSLPETLYGKELAIGYSSMTRKSTREKVNFFQANGIGPAAGFSSTVLDLAKFATWQFRLRDTTVTEILRPSTLKNMHRIHWTNPDWKTTWGLGFSVRKGEKGNTWIGHGGSCPGYRSTLQLDLKTKRAYSVMINASGTNPRKYAEGIHAILEKVKAKAEAKSAEKADPATGGAKNLQEYVGYYDQMPWWGESYVSVWNDKLVTIDLPTENPEKAMTFYKPVKKDVFRRIRDDDELGESLVFERDEDGKITKFITHGNYYKKIIR